MFINKKMLALAAPVALLALSACATGLPTKVSRFQAMPAPQGQSFTIQAADPRNQGGLEFAQYAQIVRQHLLAQGFSEAASPEGATLLVSLDYGVDNGQTRVVSHPAPFRYSRFYPAFGYYRRRHPFYWGWHDPFLSPFDDEIHAYTVYTSFLDMDIKRTSDGQAVFEGTAKAQSRTDQLPRLIPSLAQAMFTDFPGRSGEVIKITIPNEPRR